MRRLSGPIALVAVLVTLAGCAEPPPAAALDVVKPICSLAGLVSTLAGRVCSATSHPGRLIGAGKKLLGGHLGSAVESLLGDGGGAVAKTVTIAASLAAVGAWVIAGARFAMHETASVISSTTAPNLESTWFSASYWRMAGISALLTLPFLFAAAIQALLHSDLSLLARAAFGYLPLGLLAVAIAAPVTMLLLAGSDEMARIVASASGEADAGFLAKAGAEAGAVSLISRSPFLAFGVGLLAAAAALALWVELLIRSAAVYVIVLMLPLFFAALVWPARRVWAVRAVELLVALILSKFAIVAVLSLGGAALGHTTVPSFTSMLAGSTLILLAAFSPWALLRMLPLHELAAGAAAGLGNESRQQLAIAGLGGADYAEAAQELEVDRPGRPSRAEPAADEAVRRLSLDGAAERDRDDGATNGRVESDDEVSAGPGSASAAGGSGPGSASGPGLASAAAGAAAPGPTGSRATVSDQPSVGPSSPGGSHPDAATSPPAPEERQPWVKSDWQPPGWGERAFPIPHSAPREWPPRPPDPDPAPEPDQPGARDPGENHTPSEDHDPRPPGQEPEGGRL